MVCDAKVERLARVRRFLVFDDLVFLALLSLPISSLNAANKNFFCCL